MPGQEPPPEARRASLFRNGRNQALRIPRALELPGDEVWIQRDGERLIIEPISKKRGLLAVLAELEPLHEDLDPALQRRNDPDPEAQ